jgi:hypothetical protein
MSALQPVKDKVRVALTMAEAGKISDNLDDITMELARLSPSGCSHGIALLRSRKEGPDRLAIALRFVLSRLENNPELFG